MWKCVSHRRGARTASAAMLLRMMSMLGFCGNAVDILAKRVEREICEQLLHFSRAVSEPFVLGPLGI